MGVLRSVRPARRGSRPPGEAGPGAPRAREHGASVPSAMAAAALLAGLALLALRGAGAGTGACYDGAGRAQRCLPVFENAAFGRLAQASHTCGSPPEDFCPHVGAPGGAWAQCQRCDAGDPARHHNSSYLTDFHSQDDSTWWQSPSMAFGVQYPTSVNITLRLGKRGFQAPPLSGPRPHPIAGRDRRPQVPGALDWLWEPGMGSSGTRPVCPPVAGRID